MSALSLANLSSGASPIGEAADGRAGRNSAQAFRDAMARQAPGPSDPAVASPAADPARAGLDGPARPNGAQPAQAEADAGSRERVRRSLGLDGAPAATAGDTILGGLTKLRSVFDARQTHLNDIMSSSAANTQMMFDMQMEMAQYTVMVDLSSKLTGKASSTLDTLMKGQ